MLNRIDLVKICIICEGYEEYDYFNKLISLNVFSSKYQIKLINAKGEGNITARYQSYYNSGGYHLVLIFCDTDKFPYIHYNDIKNKIDNIHGKNKSSNVIIFGNPCTMQIIINHFSKDVIKLNSPSKRMNASVIYELTGIDGYNATDEQRKQLMNNIKRSNYYQMKSNLELLSNADNIVSSTNILDILNNLESDNTFWIDEINNKIDM